EQLQFALAPDRGNDHGNERDESQKRGMRGSARMVGRAAQQLGTANRDELDANDGDDQARNIRWEQDSEKAEESRESSGKQAVDGGHAEDQRETPHPAGEDRGCQIGKTAGRWTQVSRSEQPSAGLQDGSDTGR